ncbi:MULTISPECIES: LicD family protein [Pediococcus]|uniref:Lipopolysaccharide cholinephosphotransferase LicD n=1 Tax=Pediococcus pentosaceus TaxID=1255 RepID=A0A1Y0W064_PEDPE|nr:MULTISPECIES: LicD family protein [Pediococcus]ARW20157.1 Lipopolysaccharide cholinephosphotransferase LicD [Pediococcus pentosaceus]KAF5438476.1 LicD family protein [Pediococcus sp. EKM202D]KAF5438561.1 LicD family protein [Pediococcus sp. EKM201D]UQB01325.1 LicD family protein [Pediococcus pentosaceus]UQB03174.1 LicD family protein [Pediococcus pentosaceus]
MDKELRKLQLIDINILNEVVDILEENKLRYFLIAGTLLGAVRHKGFIPWDDDMDIAMPRKDYDKFLDIFSKKLPPYLHVKNFMTDSTFKYYITRIIDDRYKVQEIRNENIDESITNISIDIFPIDGVPDNSLKRQIYYFKILTYRALISLIQKENIDKARKRKMWERIAIFIGTKVPLRKIINPNKLHYRIDRLLKKQSNNSKYAGSIMGAYRTKEIMPRKYFGEGKKYTFEGRTFRGPTDYDSYLKHMYGNYMELPDIEEQKNKRHFKIL